jgi:hypothetical protein
MVQAGDMAIGYRYSDRVDESGVRWIGYVERECVVLRVSLGMARIQWCSDGRETAVQVSELRPE